VNRFAPFIALTLLVTAGAVAGQQPDPEAPTLLVYSSIERLYVGQVTPTMPLADAEAAIDAYPPEWAVVGVATTNMPLRNGEVMIDGTVADTRYWWADPDSANHATLFELNTTDTAGDAEATPAVLDDPEHEFPFLALSVADAETAITLEGDDIPDLHAWLIEQLEAEGIALAGIQVTGDFSAVHTSISHDLPTTGFVIVDGRVSEDIFHYVDYEEPGAWVIDGVYAAEEDAQLIVSVAGRPLHLHGYQTDGSVGGHIQSAVATHVTATIYPLKVLVQTLDEAS